MELRGCSKVTCTHLQMQRITTRQKRAMILSTKVEPESSRISIPKIWCTHVIQAWQKRARKWIRELVTEIDSGIALLSTTVLWLRSPITFFILRFEVPLFNQINELHGGPPWHAPSSTILKAPCTTFKKPGLRTDAIHAVHVGRRAEELARILGCTEANCYVGLQAVIVIPLYRDWFVLGKKWECH